MTYRIDLKRETRETSAVQNILWWRDKSSNEF